MKKFSVIIIFILLFILGHNFCEKYALADVFSHPVKLKMISNEIPKMGSIKCKFRQEKTVPNLQKPLVSGGDFEFIENKGVYFYTKYPIVSTVDYTNKNYKQINEIVSAISSKKYSKLEKEFDFFFEPSNAKGEWGLGLRPKQGSYAFDYISFITLNGSDYIHKINIVQTNGNKTTIWFTK